MPEGPWDKEQHELYAQRIEEHLDRVDARLGLLEKSVEAIHELALSVQSLAGKMETMSAAQTAMQNTLHTLESRDGDSWRKFKWYVLTTIVGIAIGACAVAIGLTK